ncbi:MAG: alpha-2-macroglobulin family protein, partial [Chitinophagales bacterium]
MSFYKLLLIPFFSIFLSMPWWQEPAKSAKYYEQSKWAELDSLRDIRQSQLLYKKSDAILQKALKENQHAIALKALNYKMMSREFREENAAQKNFEELELLIENSEFPLNQILASMQVELLQNFYSRKKYSIDQRKATSNERDAQLDYWTKNDFQEKMLELQLFAISNAEKLDAEKLNSYKILFHKNQKDSSEYLSKSLYPILFNRALSWFASMDFESTNPKTESAIEQPVLFAPIPEFVKIDISKDSLLTQNTGSIFLFREILHFYNKKEEELVLTHFNIERLKWAHSVSTLNNKDSLLLKSYAQFRNTLTTDAARNWVNSERARLFQNLSNNAEWASQEDKVTFRKGALFIASILLAKNDTAFWKNRMQQLKEEILSETFSAELPEHSFPGSPNLVQVNYKNKKQVYWQLIKFNSWSDELRWHNTKEAFSELKKGKVLHNGRFDLKGSEDYFPHSMEFKLPALEAGNYILLLSDSAEFTDTSQLHLKHFNTSNLTVVHRKNSENGALEWVVRDAKSGAALKGAELQLYFKSYDYQSRKSIYKTGPKLKSNSKGLCSWMSGDKYRGSIYIDVSYNDEKLEKLGSFYSSPPQKPTDRPAINFFSDRSIYRPGQTLHFKAIAVQPNGNERSLKSNWTQEFQLLDANYQEIDKKSLKSDDYGAFNASFQLPESGLNGNYRIKTNYGTYTFKVEAYERPKFEIELLPLEGFVKIGDSIKIKGNAASFAGVALQNADLKYRVELLPQYRPYYQRGGWYPGIKGKEISFGALKVDDKGNFEFSFLAKKGKQEDFQNYKVEVSATDITGETQKSEKIYRIDKAPFQIKAAIPQYIYDRENAKWNIRAVNSSEATVPAAGKIKVYKLQSPEKPILARSNEPAEFSSISEAEFKKNWPYLAFKEEHKKENWPQGELVYEAGIKDDTVLTPDFLQHAEAGAYKAEITLWGGSSQPIQQEQYFSLFDLEKLKMPAAEAAFFHISESSAKVGESLELFIGSGFKNAEFEVLIAYKDGEESNRHTISNELKQISIPIHKSYEGNFTVEVNMVKFGRSFSFNKNITVPYENSKLKLELESKRSTLTPGSEEEWTIRIKDEKGKPVVASLLAAMYDASLDQIYAHSWSFNPMPVFSFNQYSWSGIMGQKRNNLLTLMRNDAEVPFPNLQQPQIPDFESIFSRYYGLRYRGARSEALSVDSDNEMAEATEDESAGGKSDKVGLANYAEDVEKAIEKTQEQPEEKVRSNFAETAFFFAHIESNESGESVFKFTLPDAITRWKMQALAHSKSLQYGLLTESFEARKELMIEAQPQRFLRQGDSILFHAKISNLSDKAINVSAMLQWLNPYSKTELTPQFIDKSEMKIQLSPNEVKSISWPVKVPADFDQPLMYRLKAKSESFTDGEEKMLPVLKNNIALSKSRAFQIDENQDKIFDLEKLKQLPEKAQIRAIELEINPNPHWYIIQALPYLTASNYKSSNTLFNQFYAQSISASLANRSPDIRLLFQQWGDALKAPLQRGEALAISELNNTPWLRDALKDEQRMKNISQLFDVNMLNYEMEQSLKELLEMQSPNGGWPWIKSMPDSRFITQKIVLGFARLQDKKLINSTAFKNL